MTTLIDYAGGAHHLRLTHPAPGEPERHLNWRLAAAVALDLAAWAVILKAVL